MRHTIIIEDTVVGEYDDEAELPPPTLEIMTDPGVFFTYQRVSAEGRHEYTQPEENLP